MAHSVEFFLGNDPNSTRKAMQELVHDAEYLAAQFLLDKSLISIHRAMDREEGNYHRLGEPERQLQEQQGRRKR
jgi:hypothetical protein